LLITLPCNKDTNSRSEEWAAAVIVGQQRILQIIEANNGPLFVTIDKQARSHISSVRFAGDGGPKTIQSPNPTVSEEPKPAPQPTMPEPEILPAQGDLFKL
jgi:hypothetical protein